MKLNRVGWGIVSLSLNVCKANISVCRSEPKHIDIMTIFEGGGTFAIFNRMPFVEILNNKVKKGELEKKISINQSSDCERPLYNFLTDRRKL